MCKPTFLPPVAPNLAARRRASGLLRQFALGRCTPEAFDEWYDIIAASCDDAVVQQLYTDGLMWCDDLPDDWHQRDARIAQTNRQLLLRCAVFLQSRQNYGWPQRGFCASLVAAWCRLLTWLSLGRLQFPGSRDEDFGCETEAWPFLNRVQYEAALQTPRLLCGRQAA